VKKKKLDDEIETYKKEEDVLAQNIKNSVKHEQEFMEKIEEFDSSLSGLSSVKDTLSLKKTELEHRRENRSRVFLLFSSASNALNDFERQIQNDDRILNRLKEEILDLEKRISDLNSKRTALEQKLPVLETEKKNMIQQKNFKVFLKKIR
jgi:chromosome segregation ATPase